MAEDKIYGGTWLLCATQQQLLRENYGFPDLNTIRDQAVEIANRLVASTTDQYLPSPCFDGPCLSQVRARRETFFQGLSNSEFPSSVDQCRLELSSASLEAMELGILEGRHPADHRRTPHSRGSHTKSESDSVQEGSTLGLEDFAKTVGNGSVHSMQEAIGRSIFLANDAIRRCLEASEARSTPTLRQGFSRSLVQASAEAYKIGFLTARQCVYAAQHG